MSDTRIRIYRKPKWYVDSLGKDLMPSRRGFGPDLPEYVVTLLVVAIVVGKQYR